MCNCDKKLSPLRVCSECGKHFEIGARERICLLCDERSFTELNADILPKDILNFPGYKDKITKAQEGGENEAVITGMCKIGGNSAALFVMESRFMLGSVGRAAGEKITRLFEYATDKKLPLIGFTLSGGARMQEGIISLMQMAKISAAVKRHSDAGLLYIVVLTDPTMGGAAASFASLGDIILAEPNALIGFAGPRVIEQVVRQKLPPEFQRAEFLLKKGFIDAIVGREEQREHLRYLLSLHRKQHPTRNTQMISENFLNSNPTLDIRHQALNIVKIARASDRPRGKVFIFGVFQSFFELHGDRRYGDDGAVIGGIGTLDDDCPVTVITIEKGANTEERIERNFGSPKPEGYRKALRLMKQAEKFDRSVICFVDTGGADCGIEAEERGQGQAIAENLAEISALKVPVITVITGEGGSGGALALSIANEVYMLENSVYSVISPEGCASILFKDIAKTEEAARYLKLTAPDLLKLGVIEGIIPEDDGLMDRVKNLLLARLATLKKEKSIQEKRYDRFRKF